MVPGTYSLYVTDVETCSKQWLLIVSYLTERLNNFLYYIINK